VARKKKAAPVKRKRTKKPAPVVPDGPTELGGWKVGDLTWAVPFGTNKPSQLEIKRLNHKDKTPSLSCTDLTIKRYCVVAVDWCADTKIKAKQLYLSRSKDK